MSRGASWFRVVFACSALASATACSHPSQVSFVSNERPTAAGAPAGLPPPSAAHAEDPNGGVRELPGDDEELEPERPAADSKQERALVHIHGPDGVVCSGVVLGARLVATAQQCVKGEGKGATQLATNREYRVEVASSTLTWTNRRVKYVVKPMCDWNELDLAVLVLAEDVPALVKPLKIVSAPGTGAKVQALGFGHCAGQPRSLRDRVGTVRSRVSEAVVVDVPLCKGDTGGPVVDGTEGDVVGLISHRDDPEGSPLRTTTIARLDTVHARDLLAGAKALAEGGDVSKVKPVTCK